ncbi:hypothetical protein BDN67DRAFT_1012722 [Paxillus ammoniavirescens]|nr:hypothetical protein BDN67DRAFT_1012722 [Paxillus ammoniavirescens]
MVQNTEPSTPSDPTPITATNPQAKFVTHTCGHTEITVNEVDGTGAVFDLVARTVAVLLTQPAHLGPFRDAVHAIMFQEGQRLRDEWEQDFDLKAKYAKLGVSVGKSGEEEDVEVKSEGEQPKATVDFYNNSDELEMLKALEAETQSSGSRNPE